MANMKKVTKSELAREIGTSPQYVSKLVKQGLFDKCMTPDGKKLYLEKALEALTKGRKAAFKHDEGIPAEIIEDNGIYNADAENELNKLLAEAKSPSQKVQITKDYWLGRINRQKFLQAEGELITVDAAKAAIDVILTPLNSMLDNLHIELKANHHVVPNEAITWLAWRINEMKKDLQKLNFESNTSESCL